MNGAGQPTDIEQCDPYGDRTARDIRNRLATAFIRAIESGDFQQMRAAASRLCPPQTGQRYCRFVDRQVDRCFRAFKTIRSKRITEPLPRSVLLWNEGLFFEVHEILETVWNGEQRWRKEALRGLIQAAGVFVHRERGAGRAAEKLAARAAFHLRRHRRDLAEIDNVEELIEALEDAGKPTPKLRLIG